MQHDLRQYLIEAYEPRRASAVHAARRDAPIQIDDQTDDDNITEFCTIFVQVRKRNVIEIDLDGAMPVTQSMTDLVETYGGTSDRVKHRLTLRIRSDQVGALTDLAARLEETANDGGGGNPGWSGICARTAGSLRRFARLVEAYLAQMAPR